LDEQPQVPPPATVSHASPGMQKPQFAQTPPLLPQLATSFPVTQLPLGGAVMMGLNAQQPALQFV
jgi:hypothetical protein